MLDKPADEIVYEGGKVTGVKSQGEVRYIVYLEGLGAPRLIASTIICKVTCLIVFGPSPYLSPCTYHVYYHALTMFITL